MASSHILEEFENVGLCNCCLQNNSLKCLWDELYWEGDSETYIAMLSKCFSLTFEYYDDSRICDECIAKLTAAVEFKKQVIEAAKQLKSLADNIEENDPNVKNEPFDGLGEEYHIVISEHTVADNIEENDPNVKNEPVDGLGEEYHIVISEHTDEDAAKTIEKNKEKKEIIHRNASLETTEMADVSDEQKTIMKQSKLIDVEVLKPIEDGEYLADENIIIEYCEDKNSGEINHDNISICDDMSPGDVNNDNVSICDDDANMGTDRPHSESAQYFDVEYLEDEENLKNTGTSTPEQQTTPPKRKWPRKKKRHELKKSYKNYTMSDLEDSLEAVRTGRFTPAQSSLYYGVPKKTIAGYLRREKVKMENPVIKNEFDDEKALTRKKQWLLIEEIKKVLMYTNATPFRAGKNTLYCAYCYLDGPFFDEDPDGLRTHTRTAHASERVRKIGMVMRPYCTNEILRLDVLNLVCNVCSCGLTWNELIDHLKTHDIEMNEDIVNKQLVPYILKTSGQRCTVCGMFSPNFHHLDSHMNTHSNSYICVECGETYLTAARLKCHSKVHATGRFPCKDCDKVFSCDRYRRKHALFVHKKNKVKCQHCDLKFNGEYERQQHILAAHRDVAKLYNCEFCGMLFTWKQSYSDHMRKVHANRKKFKCTQCRKSYDSYVEYETHKLTHTAKAKKLVCRFCLKSYCNKNYLKQHYWQIHSSQLSNLLKEEDC